MPGSTRVIGFLFSVFHPVSENIDRLRPPFSHPPIKSRNSDPGSYEIAGSSSPSLVWHLACICIARRVQPFLPSSTRVLQNVSMVFFSL